MLTSPILNGCRKLFLCQNFTIDDGMIGNLELKEVFQRHCVRPVLYLCTGIICSDGGYWWLSLDEGSQIEDFKRLDNEERKGRLRELGFEDGKTVTPRQATPKDELLGLLEWADPGAHTRFHPILIRCDEKECEAEISQSRKELVPILGVALNHFAYPNGNSSDREIGFVKEAGFSTARTLDPGWNSSTTDKFRLKAIYIDDKASVDKFAVQLTGIPGFVRRLISSVRSSSQ